MTPSAPYGTVLIIDDDESVRRALSWLLRTRYLSSATFDSGAAFCSHMDGWGAQGPAEPCCAILDLRMPGMGGLEVFEAILAKPWQAALPVIFLSGHADLPVAVDAVRRGAFDFCQKPLADNQLVDRVIEALARSEQARHGRQAMHALQERLASLTEREQKVMRLMADGLPNKLIADQLSISIRTVEVHRAKIFDKLKVKTAVDMVRLLHQLDAL